MGWDFPLVALRLTATNTSTLAQARYRALSPSEKGNLHTQWDSTRPLRLYQVLKLGGLDDAPQEAKPRQTPTHPLPLIRLPSLPS